MNRNWLYLGTKNYRTDIVRILEDAGETVSVPESDFDYVPRSPWPHVVVIDHDTNRYHSTVAAYFRGRGLPVVYVLTKEGKGLYRRMMHVIGCHLVNGPEGFSQWLAAGPEYLITAPKVNVS